MQSVISRHRAKLREATIARLVAHLAAHPPAAGTERVLLFGSLARGDFDGASDADVLVIGGDGVLPDDLSDVAGRPCEVIGWTSAQWRHGLAQSHPMALEIARDAVELWPAPAGPAGAVEKIRTSTGFPPPAPQAGASTIPPRPREAGI